MEICTQVGRIYNTGAGRKDGWKGLRERGWEKEGREWEIGGGREGREGGERDGKQVVLRRRQLMVER